MKSCNRMKPCGRQFSQHRFPCQNKGFINIFSNNAGAKLTATDRLSAKASTLTNGHVIAPNGNPKIKIESFPESGPGKAVYRTAPLEVRDTELDMFGVVNNAVYATYLQHARHKFSRDVIDLPMDEFMDRGEPVAMTELNIRFKGALRSGDSFVVDTKVKRITRTRIKFVQSIIRVADNMQLQDVVVDSDTVVVCLNKDYKPIPLPKSAEINLRQKGYID